MCWKHHHQEITTFPEKKHHLEIPTCPIVAYHPINAVPPRYKQGHTLQTTRHKLLLTGRVATKCCKSTAGLIQFWKQKHVYKSESRQALSVGGYSGGYSRSSHLVTPGRLVLKVSRLPTKTCLHTSASEYMITSSWAARGFQHTSLTERFWKTSESWLFRTYMQHIQLCS